MQKTLSQHIAQLEAKIGTLTDELLEGGLDQYQRTERELAIMNARTALLLFTRAMEVEKRAFEEPSTRP